jgi:hypothetical protein
MKTAKPTTRPVTGKKVAGRKPKPVMLADVTYTDGWRRTRKRFAIERKRTQSGPLNWGALPVVYGTIGWVLVDRMKKQILQNPVNPKRHLYPHVFETEQEGKAYLKNTTLKQLELLQVNQALDRSA